MTIAATGRREIRDGRPCLVLTRRFAAPVDAVWEAVTDPHRMERWIGTWTGDPASGEISFRMTAEGEDVPAEVHVIEECDPPHRFVVRTKDPAPSEPDGTGSMVWRMSVDVHPTAEGAELTFVQDLVGADAAVAESIGPGWEYYLDRLAAFCADADVTAIDFDDYYPSQCARYRQLFSDGG